MNLIEFKKVLDVFDIHSITKSTKSINGKPKDVYSWGDIDIFFGGTYYAVVRGMVPYEVARILSKKYPDYRDDVRIHGDYGYGKVADKNCYPKDEMGNAYVESYHIDSIEGLVYLLSELKYFHNVRTYMEESRKAFYREQRELLASVYRKLLEDANLSYTTENWKEDRYIPDNNENGEIASLVRQFDETVNPYINSDIEVSDPQDFIGKIKMDINYRDWNIANMDIDTGNLHARYCRDEEEGDFLQYDICYNPREGYFMNVDHTVTEDYDEIRLYGFKECHSGEDKIDLRYDMNTGLVHSTYGKEYHQITEEEKSLFISEINKAIKVGQRDILRPMTKKANNKVKKLR